MKFNLPDILLDVMCEGEEVSVPLLFRISRSLKGTGTGACGVDLA
jgi:hypothetical protein